MSDTFKNIKKTTIVNRSFNQPETQSSPEKNTASAILSLADALKQQVAADQIESVLEQLLAHFNKQSKAAAINRAILLSGKLTEIKLQWQYDQITVQLYNQEKSRIREAILALIDTEL